MTAPKPKKVGETVDAKEVVRPGGEISKVVGGTYVLDVPGTFVVDGGEVEVEA